MSQKLNNGNTLLNYFSRSPASSIKKTPKSEKEPSAKKVKQEQKDNESSTSPISNKCKRELDSSQDEEIKIQRKRRRIIADSESEEENDSDSPKSCKTKESKSIEEKYQNENETISFEKKLKNLKQESCKKSDNYVTELETSTNLDEPIVWPHNKLDFLKPEHIKDKKGRRPDHPDYNPRTLYVPESFLNGLSPGVRQWWELKSENFDCVLCFKVGKFYELYHMDADVGVNELGFTYMRGEFAHSGFPEVSFGKMSKILIDRGYKVARVEQTETPDMMSERCKNSKIVTKFDKVVKREICQIINRGTRVYGAQTDITYDHQPNYMLSIVEKDEGSSSVFGVCFIDTSIGDFYVGEFVDDNNSSRLLTLLSHYPPVLVLFERRGLTVRTEGLFKTVLSNVLKENLIPETQSWSAEKTLKYLRENCYKKDEDKEKEWPKVLKSMQDENDHLGLTPKENSKLCLKALGGCIWYLKSCLIDEQILAMARFTKYYPPDIENSVKAEEEQWIEENEVKNKISKVNRNHHMVLDSITLNNLNITGEESSLLNTLDQCCTKFGKRLLHHWICSPSCNINVIKERQDAITELLNNIDVLQEMRSLFNGLPDFERYLAQIHSFGNGERLKNHPDGRAILFEEKIYNKKKIQNFISILKGFESLINIPTMFASFETSLINRLTQLEPIGLYPDMKEILDFFKTAFDHNEALKEGVIAPEKGIDHEFDSIEQEIEDINKQLKKYLEEQEKYFGCRLSYFGNDKKRFQLEVPESNSRKAGSDYFLEGQRKGSKPVRRFHTARTKEFLKRMIHAEEQRNNVLKDLSRRIFEKFSNYYSLWKKCVDSIATLDVLASLAEYARNQSQICVPEVCEESDKPFIYIEEGYHPCMLTTDDYIPNGISLGGPEDPPLALLTGPNMGGKSTLMRQIGLLMIMTQMGSHIPAQSCKMSIIDRIFTRLGAQDDILAGHSTFLVELNETSSILKHSTLHSLVLLDELGRGTATYDGTAIAASVVQFMADLKCRTIFSTHYHNLVDHFQNNKNISLGHMACMVENEDMEDPTQETVTFLYKYTTGACPKSYGFNAAKLAGMPHSVIKRAYELSKNVEAIAIRKKLLSTILEDNVEQVKDLLHKLKICKIK